MKAKTMVIFMGVKLMVLGAFSISWAITITEPSSGTVFHPGDQVVVKVRTTPEETSQGVFIFATKQAESTIDTQPPFELVFTIDSIFLGEDTIVASAKLPNGKIVEAETKIRVVLPPTTVLTKIDAAISNGQGQGFMTLYKHDNGKLVLTTFGTDRVTVRGEYSDGVWREITAHPDTTYTSSDEKVLKVTPPGKWMLNDAFPHRSRDAEDERPGRGALVTAVGPGRAKIIVRNGPYEDSVIGSVNVDPCSEWKKTVSSKGALPICD